MVGPFRSGEVARNEMGARRTRGTLVSPGRPLLPAKSKATLERRKTLIAQLRKASGGAGGPRRPLDAVKIGDHWYKYYDASLVWTSAEQACEQLGGQLLSIDDPAENDAMAGFLLKSAGGQEQATCWLGLSDLAVEGQFRLLDGTPLLPPLYANWQPNQPDNSGGTEDAGLLDATFSNGTLSANGRTPTRRLPHALHLRMGSLARTTR